MKARMTAQQKRSQLLTYLAKRAAKKSEKLKIKISHGVGSANSVCFFDSKNKPLLEIKVFPLA